MLKRFFITGTDTSVGKTVVSRALLQALASQGKTVAGYKPVAKGSKETPEGLRNKDALVLQSVSTIELPYEAVNPIALSEEESSVAHSCPINYTLISNGLANLTEKVDRSFLSFQSFFLAWRVTLTTISHLNRVLRYNTSKLCTCGATCCPSGCMFSLVGY